MFLYLEEILTPAQARLVIEHNSNTNMARVAVMGENIPRTRSGYFDIITILQFTFCWSKRYKHVRGKGGV